MKTEPNDLAFPAINPANNEGHPGLSKREYFASLVASGLATKIRCDGKSNPQLEMFLSSDAVRLADALIEELNKPKTDEGNG